MATWARLWLVFKPIPVLGLALWVSSRDRTPYGRLLAAGLVLSAVGDVLLEIRESLFLAGLVAFLAAHVCYIAGFWSGTPDLHALRALPFLLYGAAMYAHLFLRLGGMALPVGVYLGAIITMMWRAAARIEGPGFGEWSALIGAVLFCLSDTLIALDRFRGAIPGVRYPIMILYWLGQLGIALSAGRGGDQRSGGS